MKAIEFSKDCNYRGKRYVKGSILKKVDDFASVWRLNEKGYIKALTKKEFLELQKKNKTKEEA